MSNRLNQGREAKLQSARMDSCQEKLESLGYIVRRDEPNHSLAFTHKVSNITLYPYSGWWSGRGIGSGRGFGKLLKKLGGEK